MITVIIPTRDNEIDLAVALSALVTAAVEGIVKEVIVVDAGSRDGTVTVADAAGCTVINGNGPDILIRVAEQARSDWLLFLSPLAVLDPNWHGEALAFVNRASLAGRAASSAATFRLSHADIGGGARSAEFAAAFRSRFISAPYAEQGLLISKDFYRTLGGHSELPAMADVELGRRIGRRRLTLLRSRSMVSPRKPAAGGFRNAALLTLFLLRLPPAFIGRLAGRAPA